MFGKNNINFSMGMLPILPFFFFLATLLLATSHGSHQDIPDQIHLLRPKFGLQNNEVPGLSCQSWQFGVETNNIRDWEAVPHECESYVGNYMLGQQYRNDSAIVCQQAALYVKSVNLTGDGKDIWSFDIDETTLSNLPYYAKHGFGAEVYNWTAFSEWENEIEAPALPETLELYNKLLSMGVKVVFLTGRYESSKNVTAINLKKAGYNTWIELICRNATLYPSATTAVKYKSSERTKLVEAAYRIIGNMGDQWSDLLGDNPGERTFKLPDPMYYIA